MVSRNPEASRLHVFRIGPFSKEKQGKKQATDELE